jgi:asparagine synthase (glutamine-hydrolysing)
VIGSDPFGRPSPLEVAWGWIPGRVAETGREERPRGTDGVAAVRAALDDALRPALARTPCLVAFSGGRDSSVVLAAALDLARREGLPPPVAATKRYPGVPEADEGRWQELVIDHLGAPEWVRVDYDELDLVGPEAAASLRRRGLVWPPMAHTWDRFLEHARGGTLVSGEGGDDLFGMHRSTPVAAWLALRRPNTRSARRALALALGPRPLRRWHRRRHVSPGDRPWLRPAPAERWRRRSVEEWADAPFDHRRSVQRVPRRRSTVVGLRTLDAVGADAGVRWSHPLLDPAFVAAAGRAGGRLGFAGRSAAMRALFGDLLPDEVLGRVDKAHFTPVAFGASTRAFGAGWQGDGVDPELVDPAVLRRQWTGTSEGPPHAGTALLLHQAWLRAEGDRCA